MPTCTTCQRALPPEAFAFRSIATGARATRCRACHAVARREHYVRTKDVYVAREIARMRRYREENRLLLHAYLAEHPCVDCGEGDLTVLDFDHRDPTTKRTEVVRLAAHRPWRVVLLEIAKCDVRCASCHRRRTARQFGWRRAQAQTATPTDLSASIIDSHAAIVETGDDAPYRTCSICQRSRPSSEFALKNAGTGLRSTKCRACQRAYARQHYQEHRTVYLEKARRRRMAQRDLFAASLRHYFQTHPCVDCGEADPAVLDFDHRERETKAATANELIQRQDWSGLLTEIAKCDVRCANCHRRRTARQFGWSRLTPRLSEDAA